VKICRIVLVPHGAQWYRILRMLAGLMMASLAGWRRHFSV